MDSTTDNSELKLLECERKASRERKMSYKSMIISVIEESPQKKLRVKEIYERMLDKYPQFNEWKNPAGWQNSIRHNLSLHPCFTKEPGHCDTVFGGNYWTVNRGQIVEKTSSHTRRLARANKRLFPYGKGNWLLNVNQSCFLDIPRDGLDNVPLSPTTTKDHLSAFQRIRRFSDPPPKCSTESSEFEMVERPPAPPSVPMTIGNNQNQNQPYETLLQQQLLLSDFLRAKIRANLEQQLLIQASVIENNTNPVLNFQQQNFPQQQNQLLNLNDFYLQQPISGTKQLLEQLIANNTKNLENQKFQIKSQPPPASYDPASRPAYGLKLPIKSNFAELV